LTQIAEPLNQGLHVLATKTTSESFITRPVPVSTASVFKGYCNFHESIFSSFERPGRLTTGIHIQQQFMRSLAREVWNQHRRLIAYDRLRIMCETLIGELEPMKSGYWEEVLLRRLHDAWAIVGIDFANLRLALRDATEAVQRGSNTLPEWLWASSSSWTSGVAISGSAQILVQRGRHWRPTPIVFVSIPNGDSTLTAVGSLKEEADAVHAYARTFLKDDAYVHATMRGWMSLTDHWFANPSWWSRQGPLERRRLLSSLSRHDWSAAI
jgi:hypothetical protein